MLPPADSRLAPPFEMTFENHSSLAASLKTQPLAQPFFLPGIAGSRSPVPEDIRTCNPNEPNDHPPDRESLRITSSVDRTIVLM